VVLAISDSVNAASQVSSTIPITFQKQSISTPTITVNPNLLASTSQLSITYKTLSKYRSGFSITLTLNSDFGIPAGTVPCSCSIITAPTCSISLNTITISGGSTTVPINTQVDILFQNIRTPRCAKVENLLLSSLSSTYLIEQGNLAFNTGLLPLSSLQVDSITISTTKGQESNSLTISMSHQITLSQNSLIIATLPSEATYSGSTTCQIISGLELGATCTYKGSGVFWFENGMASGDRLVSSGPFIFKFSSFNNPKGLGNYALKIEISTGPPSGCIYSRATTSLLVDSIPAMQGATLRAAKPHRNSHEAYAVTATPRSAVLATGDSLELVLPASMAAVAPLACSPTSTNLISVSCSVNKAGALVIAPQVDNAKYLANQTIAVDVRYLRNPDASGLVTGFALNLLDSAGKVYENYSLLSQTYENYVIPEKASVVFDSDKVGEDSSITLSIKVPIRIPAQSTIVLNLTSKFKVKAQASILNANSLPISLKLANTIGNTISLQVNTDISEDTNITVVLNTSNPQMKQISPDDVKLTLLTPENMQIFAVKAIPNSLIFKCADNCQDCFGLYSNCTSCSYGYFLNAASACELQTKHEQLLPYFVFLAASGCIFIFMVVYGKIFAQVNYSANRAFAMIKGVNFLFLIYFGLTFGSNPVDMYLKYICIAILTSHLLINFAFFYFVRSPTLKPFYSYRHVEENGNMISLPDENDKDQSLGLEKSTSFSLNFIGTIGVVISLSLLRWFYGGFRKRVGVFWYLSQTPFKRLRIAFEVYELFYELFIMLPLSGMCMFYLKTTEFREVHKYMVECLSLTLLNILLHVVSLCELLPVRRTEETYLERNLSDTTNKMADARSKDGKNLMDSTLKQGSILEDSHHGLEAPLKEKSSTKLFQGKKSSTSLHEKKLVTNSVHDDEAPSTNRPLNDNSLKNSTRLEYSKMGSLMIFPSKKLRITPNLDDLPRFGKHISHNEEEEDIQYPIYPAPANLKQQKDMPDIKLIKLPEGTIRPKLNTSPPVLKEIKLDEDEKAKVEGSLLTEQPKPVELGLNHKDPGFKYTSQKTNLKDLESQSKIKTPERSRFKDNQLFSKWWFNNDTKKYLEIVYEEEDDATRLQENTEYENKPITSFPSKLNRNFLSDSKGNISISDASAKSERWPERYINGQLEQNLNKGILKDRNGVILDFKQHKKSCFAEGIFTVPHLEDKIILNAQNPGLFIKGLIRDIDGRLYRLIDQDFELLKDGIFLKRNGTIDNINGQQPEKIDLGVFTDRTSKVIDLKEQDPLCFDKNKFATSCGLTLSFDSLQDHTRFSLGLLRLPDGNEVRVKDQDLEELYHHGVYRDRDLNPLVVQRRLKGKHEEQEEALELERAAANLENEVDEGDQREPLLRRKYGEFGQSKDSLASHSRRESKRSVSGDRDVEIADPELDTLHHFPMTIHQPKTDGVNNKARSNRQSFESFGQGFPLKHDPSKGKHSEISDYKPQRRSGPIEKIPEKMENSNLKNDELMRNSEDLHRKKDETILEKHLEIPIPDRSNTTILNDSLGTNQNSNIYYENAIRDNSIDKRDSFRLEADHHEEKPTKEYQHQLIRPAVNFERLEETASFARPNTSADDSKQAAYKENVHIDKPDHDHHSANPVSKLNQNSNTKNILTESVKDFLNKKQTPQSSQTDLKLKEQTPNMFKHFETNDSNLQQKKDETKKIGFLNTRILNSKKNSNKIESVQQKNYELIEIAQEQENSDGEKVDEKEKQSRDVSFNSTLIKDPKLTNNDTLYLSKGSILPKDIQSFNSQIIFVDKHFKPGMQEDSNFAINTPTDRGLETPAERVHIKDQPDLINVKNENAQTVRLPTTDKQKAPAHQGQDRTINTGQQTGGFNYNVAAPKNVVATPLNRDVPVPQDTSTTSVNPTTHRGRSDRSVGRQDALDDIVRAFEPKVASGPGSALSRSRPLSRHRDVHCADDPSIQSRGVLGRLAQHSLHPTSHNSVVTEKLERQQTISEIDDFEPVKQITKPENPLLQRQRSKNEDQTEYKLHSQKNNILVKPKLDKLQEVDKPQHAAKQNPSQKTDQHGFKKKDYVNLYEPSPKSNNKSSPHRDNSIGTHKPLSSNGSNRNVKTQLQKEVQKKKLGSHRGLSNQSSNNGLYQPDQYVNPHPDLISEVHAKNPCSPKDFIAEPFDANFGESADSLQQPSNHHHYQPHSRPTPPPADNSYPPSRRLSSPEASKDHINYPTTAGGHRHEILAKPVSVDARSLAGRGKGSELGDTGSHRPPSEANTMYLNLVLDESVDIEFDIEEGDDDESEMARTHSRMTPTSDGRQGQLLEPVNRRVRLEDIASRYVGAGKINIGE
jgi:hypothetical protein